MWRVGVEKQKTCGNTLVLSQVKMQYQHYLLQADNMFYLGIY